MNPVKTTTVHATPRLIHQSFCGTNYFVTVNYSFILLGSNKTRLYDTYNEVPFMTYNQVLPYLCSLNFKAQP
jgi:hypothetical protein